MQALTQIIETLKPGETRLIRSFYNIQSNGEGKRRLELFDLIKNNKVRSDSDASMHMYGKPPGSAYSHLKTRLKNDLLKILLLHDSSQKFVSNFAQAEFDCRRLFIEGDLLMSRGVEIEGLEVLKKAKKIAIDFELYNEHIMIAEVLRNHVGLRKGIDEYSKYSREIEDCVEKLKQTLIAKDYYHRILVPNLFQRNKEKAFQNYAQQAVTELRAYFKKTDSAKIGYYYYYISIFYYELIGDLNNALKSALAFLRLIEERKAINTQVMVAKANLQIANILIYLESFEKAIEYCEKARQNFTKGMLNELLTIEVLFFAYFRSRKYELASKIMGEAMSHPKFNSSQLNPAKWSYYKANLLFAMTNFEGTQDILMENSEILKDKSGWLFGHKTLEIMTLLEIGNFDLIEYRVEALRKLIQRHKEENVARIKAIVRILESLQKTGFKYDKAAQLERDNFKKLKTSKEPYKWDPMGHEVIRFDEWFLSKAK